MLGAMRRWPPSRPTQVGPRASGPGRASGTRWRAGTRRRRLGFGEVNWQGKAPRRRITRQHAAALAQERHSRSPPCHRTRLRVEIIIVHAGLRCRPSNNPEGPDSTRPKPTYNGRWNLQSVYTLRSCLHRAFIGSSIFFSGAFCAMVSTRRGSKLASERVPKGTRAHH